jgi:Domain of unknown function (DUF222)
MFDDLTDRELEGWAQRLHGQRCELDATEAELLAEVERRRGVQPSGYRDAAAWLRNATGVAAATARSRVAVARTLAKLPLVASALGAGQVGWDHARTLAEVDRGRHRDRLADEEWTLAADAMATSADQFRDRVAGWVRDLDDQADAGRTPHERQRRRRRLRFWTTREGMRAGRFELDDEAFPLVHDCLRDLVNEEHRAERGLCLPPEQLRTTEQRWADALVEMARRSRGADVTTKHKARPTILAITDIDRLWDQLKVRGWCQLSDGTKLTARQLRRLACQADIIPMVLDTDGTVLDMGRRARLATYDQRLALRVMHHSCAVKGCDIRFDWCEIHHLRPWDNLGLTNLDNLVPLCTYHHHLIHNLDLEPKLESDRSTRINELLFDPHRRRPLHYRPHRPHNPRPPDRVPARC